MTLRITARSLVLTGVLSLAIAHDSAAQGAPRASTLAHRCVEINARGIFNAATLDADPRLARAVDAALCRANYGDNQLIHAGFGYGTSVRGQVLINPSEGRPSSVDYEAARHWYAERCTVESIATEPWTDDRALWQPAYALVPKALYNPWRACTDFFQPRYTFGERVLSCIALGEPDDDSRVTFEAHYMGEGLFDFSTRLRNNLQVEGATCPAPWRAGSRVSRSYRGRSITCQRQGDATVRFHIASKKLSCDATVPPASGTEPAPPHP